VDVARRKPRHRPGSTTREDSIMKTVLGLAAAAVLTVVTASASAEDKILAIVVKGLDNPFFEQINLGCQKANAELKGTGYQCLYTGPASSADEAGEVQIVDDLLTKGVAAIAISPSNAPLMANLLKQRAPQIPVMTIDADLGKEDAGLRKTYLGTDNYLMGVKFAEYLQKLKPNGGTICLQLGNVAADNINARAAGTRDTLSGVKGTERLTGQNGWTEVDGCPVYTNDQADLANQQMADIFTANPDLDAFVLEGGWAQFAPQAYAQVTDGVMDKLKSGKLIIVAGDTLPPQMEALKAGRSHVQVGQRPFEMGYRAPFVMKDMIEGKQVEPVIYTGLDECTQGNIDTCIQK
jgi:ribose transport system substrate-binding protein